MEAIATQLGVSAMTISKDLVNFKPDLKLKPTKTATNPKGAGRPKGAKSGKVVDKHAKIVALADAGISKPAIAEQTGVGERMVDPVLEIEGARREPVIDPATLSMPRRDRVLERAPGRVLVAMFAGNTGPDFARYAVARSVFTRIDVQRSNAAAAVL
jgi:hypothetical protein